MKSNKYSNPRNLKNEYIQACIDCGVPVNWKTADMFNTPHLDITEIVIPKDEYEPRESIADFIKRSGI